MIDGNNVITEKDICEAISYHEGIAGTTVILFNGENLKEPVLKDKKEFKASRTGVRETHEVVWTDSASLIYKISDITVPERVILLKISNY